MVEFGVLEANSGQAARKNKIAVISLKAVLNLLQTQFGEVWEYRGDDTITALDAGGCHMPAGVTRCRRSVAEFLCGTFAHDYYEKGAGDRILAATRPRPSSTRSRAPRWRLRPATRAANVRGTRLTPQLFCHKKRAFCRARASRALSRVAPEVSTCES